MAKEMAASDEVTFFFNGEKLVARQGQTVAAAILANGERVLRNTRVEGRGRGIFCGIGACFDCLVTIEGVSQRRACLIRVSEGLTVESQ